MKVMAWLVTILVCIVCIAAIAGSISIMDRHLYIIECWLMYIIIELDSIRTKDH